MDGDAEAPHYPQTIGYFVLTEGPRAPSGGYRQCRVQVTRAGMIVLAPLDSDDWGALIRTVTLPQLHCIMDSFYAAPALPEEATG